MDADLTFMIVFCISLIFQMLYFRYREGSLGYICCLVAAFGWIVLAPLYLAASPEIYEVAYFFYLLGVLDVIFVISNSLLMLYRSVTKGSRRSELFE